MKNRFFWILTALVLLAAVFAGCSKADETESEDYGYAEEMVDNILAGIKDRDYAVFSRDFSDTMKNALPEESFIILCDLLDSKIGEYQSRTFGGAEEVDQGGVSMTVIVYTAEYTDEPEGVIITVYFSGDEGARKVETLVFDSPKLRQQ